jgi:hypothetical protein
LGWSCGTGFAAQERFPGVPLQALLFLQWTDPTDINQLSFKWHKSFPRLVYSIEEQDPGMLNAGSYPDFRQTHRREALVFSIPHKD